MLTITRIDGAGSGFTAAVDFAPHASVSGQTTAAHVVTIPTPTGGDSFTLTVGANVSSATSGVDAGAIATALASWADGLTGYAASASAAVGEITIVSLTGAASFAVTLERTHTDTSTDPATVSTADITSTADATENGAVFDFTGPAVTGESWSAGGQSFTAVTNGLGGVIDGLAGSYGTGVATFVRGLKLALASASALVTGAGATILADTAAGDVVGAAQATRIATLSAPVNTGDTWSLIVAGSATPTQFVAAASSATSADAVTAGLAGGIYPAGYTATAAHSKLYVTSSGNTTFTLAGVVARGTAATGTIGGAPLHTWRQTVALVPAGAPAIGLGDTWTIDVGGTTHTARVTASVTDGWTFLLDGTTSDSITGKSSAGEYIAAALAAAIGTDASVSGGSLVVASADGTPLAVGTIVEQRLGAALAGPSVGGPTIVDSSIHYSSATLDLLATATPVWQAGETWTLTVDGVDYTYTATGSAPTDPLETIAAGLAAAFTDGTHDVALSATASGTKLTIADSTNGAHAFTVSVKRGGNGVKGVLDLVNTNTVSGAVTVPVVLPGFEGLVAAYPWMKQFFSISDSLGFTAQPMFQLIDPNGNVVRTVTCSIDPRTDACASPTTAPFLDYTFTQAGTYTVKVGAYVTWNAFTDYLNVANTFFANGMAGVSTGIHYTLNVSLQYHAVNEQALTLDGKTITIVSGPGVGQTATITHYDPQTATYTLDRKWATAPGPGSRFEISQSTASLPGYQPSTDSYQVVLTSQPTANVYVTVSPQPTPTYNAAAAFDPAQNYGQNNQVQVRVQTMRALFLLTGTPAAGETWTILLNDRAFSYRVTGSGDLDLATIAGHLADVINGANAGYTATIDPGNAGQLVIVSDAAFYAGFQVSHDLAGGATVTPVLASGAAITFTGTPAAGETWTLTLDGTGYSTTAAAGDTLAAIVTRIAAELPATYTTNIAGTVLTVSRDTTGGAIAASVSVGQPTPGAIYASTYFNQATLTFSGQPVAGEQWNVSLDGNTYSVESQDGQSLASVVQGIAAQIPAADYAVGVGLDSLVVTRGFWLFGGYFFIDASANVTLTPGQSYGGAGVATTHPTGVTVALNGTPATGESWSLALDGNHYATQVAAGETLAQIASALAAQIPTTPAAAQGGPVYAVDPLRVEPDDPPHRRRRAGGRVRHRRSAGQRLDDEPGRERRRRDLRRLRARRPGLGGHRRRHHVPGRLAHRREPRRDRRRARRDAAGVAVRDGGQRRHARDHEPRRPDDRRVRLGRARHAGDAGHRHRDRVRRDRRAHARRHRRQRRDLDAHRRRHRLRGDRDRVRHDRDARRRARRPAPERHVRRHRRRLDDLDRPGRRHRPSPPRSPSRRSAPQAAPRRRPPSRSASAARRRRARSGRSPSTASPTSTRRSTATRSPRSPPGSARRCRSRPTTSRSSAA